MYKKMLVLTALLIVGGSRALAHSRQKGTSDGYPYVLPVQSPGQPARAGPGMEQRSLFRQCVYTAELARKHLDELGKPVTQGRLRADEIQPHLREVRSAVTSMLEDHHRFLYMLTEQQWNSTRDSITRLEQLRAAINAQLEGFDDELQMPAPDAKVLTRYVKKTDRALREWQMQHRSLGATLDIRNR